MGKKTRCPGPLALQESILQRLLRQKGNYSKLIELGEDLKYPVIIAFTLGHRPNPSNETLQKIHDALQRLESEQGKEERAIRAQAARARKAIVDRQVRAVKRAMRARREAMESK